jgi:hypothetical protein
MALQSVKGFVAWPGTPPMGWGAYNGAASITNFFGMSLSGHKVGFMITPPTQQGNLSVTDVAFYVSDATAAGSGSLSIQTVGADGNPSGSLVTASASVALSITTTGVKVATLAGAASLTAATPYAVTISWSAGTWGAGATAMDPSGRGGLLGTQIAWVRSQSGGTWSTTGTYPQYNPSVAFKLTGGSYALLPYINSVASYNKTTFNNTTSVRKRGSAFTPRFSGTVCGWEFYGGGFQSTDFTVELRATDGTLLASWSGDKDYGNYYSGGVNYVNFIRGYFSATVDLTAGTTYDLLLVPGSATNMTVVTGNIMTADAASIQALAGQSDNVQVEIDSGAVRTTDATKWPLMNLLFSRLDDGVSSGGGSSLIYNAGMTGGIVG